MTKKMFNKINWFAGMVGRCGLWWKRPGNTQCIIISDRNVAEELDVDDKRKRRKRKVTCIGFFVTLIAGLMNEWKSSAN